MIFEKEKLPHNLKFEFVLQKVLKVRYNKKMLISHFLFAKILRKFKKIY